MVPDNSTGSKLATGVIAPVLPTLAMISVFKVGVATFSWNTTILLVVGAVPAVNAFETIVVDVVAPGVS